MNQRTISSTFGNHIKVTVSGGSHEPEMKVVMESFPGDITPETIDHDALAAFLARRAPGNSDLATARKETDRPVLTCEEPLTFVIRNEDHRSSDYDEFERTPRPGHADLTAKYRYGDSVNMAGGGPFSGRMTAPLCVAGGIALQWLEARGVSISARLIMVGGVYGDPDLPGDGTEDPAIRARILEAKEQGDSVGGLIRCAAKGVPAGIGGAMYDGLESYLAPIVFGIPGVKGVSFGDGFEAATRMGSENNDPFLIEETEDPVTGETKKRIITATNHAGGILGGITDGMDVLMDVAFKPTASIARDQQTVDRIEMKDAVLSIGGRHDPCIAVRAVPVVEAAMALGLLDAICATLADGGDIDF